MKPAILQAREKECPVEFKNPNLGHKAYSRKALPQEPKSKPQTKTLSPET